MDKILRDYQPSEPKGLVDNRRPSGGGYSMPQVVEQGINAPRHSTQGGAFAPINKGTSIHYWKVNLIGETITPGTYEWEVLGNNVFSQGMTAIIDFDEVVTGAGVGYIVLRITRDEASREMTAADLIFEASPTISTESLQYRPIAKVDPDGVIGVDQVIQMQFEEIRIWELMIVENGEFSLMGAEMSHRNTYAPPP